MPASVSIKFPQVVAAFREADKSLWKIADAVIAECGPPGDHGVNTGVLDKVDRCARELRRLGFETSSEYLRDLRRTAANFPDGVRTPSVPFTVHLEAGDPETLKDAMEAAAQDGVRPTVDFVKEFKKSQRQGEGYAEGSESTEIRAIRAIYRAFANAFDLGLSTTKVANALYLSCVRAQRWPDFITALKKYFRQEAA